MDKNKLYWFLQITGWLAYALVSLFFASLTRGVTPILIGAYLSLATFYFLSTHVLRFIIKSKGWFDFPIEKLLIHIFIAISVLSVINTGVQMLIKIIFDIFDASEELAIGVLLANVIGNYIFYTLWSMIYFLYYFLSNYNSTLKYQAKINEIKLIQLRNQLNPHFIFNALNSVRALVDEDPRKAKSAITQLSNILRYALIVDKHKTIPFGEELNTVKDYLELETIRFEERLKVVYEIEDAAYQYRIPPMMLQTIVENAIKHGISNLMKGGIILIKCNIGILEDLYIWVKNSGQLREKKENSSKVGGHGISNTIERLKLIYNDRASFKIFNHGEEFVVTEIKIPKQSSNLE